MALPSLWMTAPYLIARQQLNILAARAEHVAEVA
jgi:hypothetical protein